MVFQDGCGSAGLVLCLGNSSSQAAAGKSADSSYNGAGLRIFSSSCSSSDELEISKQTRLDQLFPSNSTTGGADSEPITLSLSLANTSTTHHVPADHEVGALKANIAKIDVNKVYGDDDHDEKDELGSAAPPANLSSSNSPNYSSTRESYVKISTYNNKYVKRERDHQHQVISTTTTTHPAEDLDQMNVERVNSSKSTTLGGDDDDEGNGRKKLRLTKEQSALLEDSFKEHSTLNPKQKQVLAKQLNLRPRQVEVWFQNRRARTKLKQTEVDCEFLKRCCETLTDENRRLHKELQELRALKFASPLCLQLPAATLTMCPSCERIATKETNKTHFTMTTKSPFYNPFNHSSSAAC